MSEPTDEPQRVDSPAIDDAMLTGEALFERYQQHLKMLASLPELPMRIARTGQLLEGLSAPVVSWWIDQILRGALWGHQDAMDAMLALSCWLIDVQLEDRYELQQRLFEAAHQEQREGVLFLLRTVPPHRSMVDGAKLPEVRLPLSRDVSLGERRAMAAGSNRRYLERLLMDPSELVLDKLLDNPHIRTEDLLSVAARRPTKAELLELMARHRRWIGYLLIREALTRNPYISTGIALKLLPTLPLPLLRQLRNATDLHPALNQYASLLITLREERTAPWRV